ncbi:MAG: low temperature requirement protein A [Sphaerospermopsis sp. SIO1G2]|nr:low temperature requirement protein A [Sphaerospermopsis sp. SIO1G2]
MTKPIFPTPRLRQDEQEEQERRATWLELFFDLIFVVAVSQLAHTLSEDFNLNNLPKFALLFIPVWWCWIGSTFYATRFDNDSFFDRLITLAQMGIISIMAVNIDHGFDVSAFGFILSYVAFRGLLVCQYINAGYHIQEARPLTTWYASGFGISVLIWLSSAFVPLPWRLLLWGLGLFIDFITPLTAGKFVKSFPPSISHISERIGLFTIIVLGESAVAVVTGISEQEWNLLSILTALGGLIIAFSFWWIYFDSVDSSALECMKFGKMKLGLAWLYIHLPLVMGLTATGVSIEHLITNDVKFVSQPDKLLFSLAIFSCLLSLAVLHWLSYNVGRTKYKINLVYYRLIAAILVLSTGLIVDFISAFTLVMIFTFICLCQIILDVNSQEV